MTYFEKLKDPRWQKKRLCVMKRDGFKCRDCGDGKSSLQVHHCHYSKGEPWDTPDDFLLTLCEECHERRQETERSIKHMLSGLCANSPIDHLLRTRRRLHWAHCVGARVKITLLNADGAEINIPEAHHA